MTWFETNNPQNNIGLGQRMRLGAETWGKQTFASSFARGGVASTVFAPSGTEAFKRGIRRPSKFGSTKHIMNLEALQAEYPNNKGVQRALNKAKAGEPKMKIAARVGRLALGVGFVAMPFFTTPGGVPEKARGVAGGLAGLAGWEIGSKIGMATGAAIGTAILPGVGTAIGAGVGWLAGGLAGAAGLEDVFHGTIGIADRMVDRERARRRLNWHGDQTAFMTQNAHTMRQQSLQAMNRGMMNARSMLGREGVMLHQ